MSSVKTSHSDIRNAATATSESYRILSAALNGDRYEHGPGAGRLRRRMSKATAEMERAAGEELASAFVGAGSSKFSEALAEAAFSALGGSKGRSALDALPRVTAKLDAKTVPQITVIAPQKPAKIRRNGVTVPMLMAVAAGEIRRDAIAFRFTAAKAGIAIRDGIRTLAAQHLLARSISATKRFVAGVPKKAAPIAIGMALLGSAAIGMETDIDLGNGVSLTLPGNSSYEEIAAAAAPAPDADNWRFPVTLKSATVGFVGAEGTPAGEPSREFLELAHRALAITLKDDAMAATQIVRMVYAMKGCQSADNPCRVESLGIAIDPMKDHHTIRLLPASGYDLKPKAMAFDFQGTYGDVDEVVDYVNQTYDEMFGASVENRPKY